MPRTKYFPLVLVLCCTLGAGTAFALSTDRDQQLLIDADHQKSTESQTNSAKDPNITHLDGNVVMTQGSMKAHGDHATVYQNPKGVLDANGNAGSLVRIVLTGKLAHMEQLHDDDCGLMTADAENIDYHNDTGIAILTKSVHVVQKGKGEFHGEYMIYNRNTGEMESGDNTPTSRVHMVMEPKSQPSAAAPSADNCGYPAGPKVKAAKAAEQH
jgi:lipopolysaccharide export system protein LptA